MNSLSLKKENEPEEFDFAAIYQAGKNAAKNAVRFIKEFWESCEHDSKVAAWYRAAYMAEQNAQTLQNNYAIDYMYFGNAVYACLVTLQHRLKLKNLIPSEIMLPENERRVYIDKGELVFVYEAGLVETEFYKSLSSETSKKYIPHQKAKMMLMRTLAKELEWNTNYRFRDMDVFYDDRCGYRIIVRGIQIIGVVI